MAFAWIKSTFLEVNIRKTCSSPRMRHWKSFCSVRGAQHFHCVCNSFAVLTSLPRWSSMKSKASLLPLGSMDDTRSASSSAAFTAIISSSSPKLVQSVFWMRFLSSFSFISHSLAVFSISAFCCSFNTGTSAFSSTSARYCTSTSSLASMTLLASFVSFFKLSLSSSSDSTVLILTTLLPSRENWRFAVVLLALSCSSDFESAIFLGQVMVYTSLLQYLTRFLAFQA